MLSGRRKFPATRAAAAIGLGAGVLGLGPAAWAAEPTQQEMLEQIKALQAKVEQLEARQQQQQSPPAQPAATQPAVTQPAEQGDTLDSVLRDAERRSSPSMLQSGGFTAGYSKNKFIIQDEAGNFSLNPNIQFQFRHVANFRSDATAGGTGDDAVESGFEVRRLKFAFEGNAFGPNLTYVFKWATDRTNGTPLLEDAWVRYALGDFFGDASKDFAIRAGQYKDPTFHEEITSSKRQLAVDRSLANEVLGGGITDFIQAVSLVWDDGPEGRPLRAEIGYSDGINSDNTNFVDSGGSATYGAANPDWGAFTRVEYLAMGNWKQYDDFTAMGNTEDLLVFGGGASYTETGKTTGGGDTVFFTGDVQYETGRLGLYGAYYGVYGEPASADTGGVMDWGFLVQGGLMLNDKWELFVRYDQVELDGHRLADGVEDSFPEATVGLNWYFKGHAAKFTIDGTYLPNGSPANLTGIGILDPDGDDSQFVLRSQFQLLL